MKDFDLDPTLSRKESTNENDHHYLLMYLWTQDTHVYPEERQRVQQSLMTLLIVLTTVRPGALAESGCYRGTYEALSTEMWYYDLSKTLKTSVRRYYSWR